MESETSIELDNYTLAGAWRGLCLGVMLHTVHAVEADFKLRRGGPKYSCPTYPLGKEDVKNRMLARKWIEGGVGQITWEESCEAIGVDPEMAKQKLVEHCNNLKRKPLSQFSPDMGIKQMVACSHVQATD